MEKTAADRIITEYQPKLYGLALSKTRDSREAEELASDMTYEVYLSLLRDGTVYNINSYVWRIASHVYARWVDKRRVAREREGISVDEVIERIAAEGGRMPEALIDREDDLRLERAEQADTLRRLRREIAYLSETRRRIMVAHYYGGKALGDIAEELGMPVGTVKWHLYGARNTIKEGMNMERTKGTLGINPIRFCSMGHNGYAGSTGDTSAHLNTALAQNIAYAAYFTPKTEEEIAEELGITPVFVQDIVAHLEEYGFLSRVENNRLRTDIIISHMTKEVDEAIHALKLETADALGSLLAPLWMKNLEDWYEANKDSVYLPDRNVELWKWSGFMLAQYVFNNQLSARYDNSAEEKFRIARPDGGKFIAFAGVAEDYEADYDGSRYWACGYMTRGSEQYPVWSIQMSTALDDRPEGWEDNRTEDYEYLYEFITNQLPENQPNLSKYQRLFDRGLIVRGENGISVNVPVIQTGLPELNVFQDADMEAVDRILTSHAQKQIDLLLPLYPAHLQDYVRAAYAGGFGSLYMYLYHWLMDHGYLTLPEGDRRRGLMTVVSADVLPQN